MLNIWYFFMERRDHHGSTMNPTEDCVNFVQRRLSCRTDSELLTLREEASEFMRYCESELEGREESP